MKLPLDHTDNDTSINMGSVLSKKELEVQQVQVQKVQQAQTQLHHNDPEDNEIANDSHIVTLLK